MDADGRRIGCTRRSTARIVQIIPDGYSIARSPLWPVALLLVALSGQVLAERFDDQHVTVVGQFDFTNNVGTDIAKEV